MEIRNKILQLFEYRGLPELLEMGKEVNGENKLYDTYFENLLLLQQKIYDLDHILESEWKIINSDLQPAWHQIYEVLNKFGIEAIDYKDYCQYIYQYEKHELSQRKGKSITRLDMEYFYFYKSCDVKLIRRLIYEYYPELEEFIPIESWRHFDLITEVNDDVDDIFEDIGTNNGNRFLLHIEQDGIQRATSIFESFLNNIHQEFLDIKGKKVFHPIVEKMTNSVHRETLHLLQVRNQEVKSRMPQMNR